MEQSSTVDGRALFSTSSKSDDGSQSQKAASSTIAKPLAPGGQVVDVKILRTLASYLWMKDNLEFRVRVIAALGLLVGAKVCGMVHNCLWFCAVVNLLTLMVGAWCFSDFECSGPFLVQACN